jgi:2-methylcitrate dehydratase PrpD
MDDITNTLAGFCADLAHDGLPSEVAERAKLLMLDTAGIIVRARHDAESTPPMVRAVERMGLGGDFTVFGDGARYAPPAAALLNGALAHSLDFDDTHAAGSIHSSAPIFPAAFAAGEMTGATGRELIAAVVAGYEVQIRLSLALDPADHYARGFHPSATCGVFGAAAAAGKLLGLDKAGLVSAFGIALSQAAGSMQFLENGAWTKRSHVGQAAQNGLMAALLAVEGYRGPTGAFEGKAGFLNAYAPAADPSKAIAGLGETWETIRLAVKPYPSCRYSHAAMDAIAALRAEHTIAPEEVETITVGLPRVGMNIIAEPLAAKQAPENIVDGQFSMPFCAAVTLREGKLDWDDYPRHLVDADTLALCRRVDCVVDADAEAALPANMAGKATITTPRGTFEKFVEAPRGEPGNFLSEEEFRAKFRALAGPYLGEEAEALADRLLTLDRVENIRALSGARSLKAAYA